jgi:hypothetical protein
VPGKAAFSRVLAFLSEQGILEQTLEGIASMSHKGLVGYQVNWDSTVIPAREKAVKKAEGKAPRPVKKRGRPAKKMRRKPPKSLRS